MGYDDRKSSLPDSEKQIMGHTKTYTKVVLDQSNLGTDQPASALIGKCVKIQVTETHKWHISGKIIDASPKPIEVPVDYFEKLDKERKEQLRIQLQEDLAIQKQREIENKKTEPVKAKEMGPNPIMHILGMAFISLGVFSFLR